ncbi:LacI family transcriptional regulator [Paeniglutamicibacter sp. ABSL32-1]|uniref:LacI family DNA-binding transcriptional regulator n=1 Tax=Paeniglutamicibacter quisquiliarum TaxID=2849498 RepID=UPI001C2DB3FE|nr:LacI family DNA-binding transcriptional regulator [Paeniglutamicibacter quisquiliarum]MBV1780233.1 LacI family transcriptional regulator [Paeniglutamicibacter quisquiliarum]
MPGLPKAPMTGQSRSRPVPEVPREGLKVRMEDVARAANVSRATVSRVLVGYPPVSPQTREQVFKAVRELGYVPNAMAQGLSKRKSDLVGLLLRDPRNPAYGQLHSLVQEAVSNHGLELITAVPHWQEGAEDELAALRRMLGLRVGGLLVSTGVIKAVDLEPFLDSVPVVSVGRVEEHPRIHGVSYDEDVHGATLANRVASAGHRSVAVLVPSARVSTAENRRGSSMAVHLEGRGITVHRIVSDAFGRPEAGIGRILELAREGAATAAMFPNDNRAMIFLRAAKAVGLDAPGDISVTGCDGIIPGLDLIGLTTLRIPVERVAQRGVEVLEGLMGARAGTEVRHEKFAGEFVPGTTLGPVA